MTNAVKGLNVQSQIQMPLHFVKVPVSQLSVPVGSSNGERRYKNHTSINLLEAALAPQIEAIRQCWSCALVGFTAGQWPSCASRDLRSRKLAAVKSGQQGFIRFDHHHFTKERRSGDSGVDSRMIKTSLC